jgi:hypothetical protein
MLATYERHVTNEVSGTSPIGIPCTVIFRPEANSEIDSARKYMELDGVVPKVALNAVGRDMKHVRRGTQRNRAKRHRSTSSQQKDYSVFQ